MIDKPLNVSAPSQGERKSASWTPGPWRVDGLWIVGSNRALLASGVDSTSYLHEVQPNLELIAAAPDLYDALAECLRMGGTADDEWMPASTIAKVNAALAKARGEVAMQISEDSGDGAAGSKGSSGVLGVGGEEPKC